LNKKTHSVKKKGEKTYARGAKGSCQSSQKTSSDVVKETLNTGPRGGGQTKKDCPLSKDRSIGKKTEGGTPWRL